MSILVKSLSLKNFLSIGNIEQTVDFKRTDLTLILGENLDLGGDGARNGVGKAQPLTSKILTPTGWTLMKDIAIGDSIIAYNGDVSRVTGVFPQGKKSVYKIAFKDGRTCEASEDHLWSVFSHQFRLKTDESHTRILTTEQIIELLSESEHKKCKQLHYLYVPLYTPMSIPNLEVPIPCYTLGAMIGDGSLKNSCQLTSIDQEIIDRVNSELQTLDCSLRQVKSNTRIRIGYNVVMNQRKINPRKVLHPFRKAVRELNLNVNSDDKFIPKIYKSCSVEQKIELLQGLLDTDGSVGKNGTISFCTTSEQLANDVAELVRSIGGLARIREKISSYTYQDEKKKGKTAYIVLIRYQRPRELLSLSRKKSRISEYYQYADSLKLQIASIERIEDAECQCIAIDHDSHLYVTDNYVVTHNTTILQGLSYALFGLPINQIKRDNLINRTNGKHMLATVEFSVNGTDYKIVRGRKPAILKFYINEKQLGSDEESDAQGENRETQEAIERVLCMSADMFQHIVGLNSYTTPFLSMKVSDQRAIIEQLLGITLLSEKAEAIKELNKTTKEDIQREEFKIAGITEANKRIQEQIDSLKKRQRLWTAKHDEDLLKLVTEYDQLQLIDITSELRAHKDLTVWNSNKEKIDRYDALLARQTAWRQKLDSDVSALQLSLDALNSIDIVAELEAHSRLAQYNQQVLERATWKKELERAKTDCEKLAKSAQKLQEEVYELEQHRCYACGQEFHDSKHTEVLENKRKLLREANEGYATAHELWKKLSDNEVVVIDKPTTHYSTETDAIKHSSEVERISKQIQDKLNEVDPYVEQLLENSVVQLGPQPKTHYDTEESAIKHSSRVATLLEQITKKHEELDPYAEQISEMESVGLQTVSYATLNNLTNLLQHQDYLLDLLTNKKSFVRKKIIEQNLSYLNNRLTHYLDKMGLPHMVVFQNDLSVEITELGRELDFDSMSRGERTRVILGLSFAFRDVWESLYHSVNLIFIDELMDTGMDTIGVEHGLALLKDLARKRNKSVWLVSHRDELTNRVNSILKVVKENGFTSLRSAEE